MTPPSPLLAAPSHALAAPLLAERGIEHGFGLRGTAAPEGCVFPKQVHGVAVHAVADGEAPEHAAAVSADAIVTRSPGAVVGIVTADCVPILVATRDGAAVGAIHAGWRGLAAGVIEAGVAAIVGPDGPASCLAAIGPAARSCCYEVDAPVREGLAGRYAALLEGVLTPGRPDRFQLDLPALAERVLHSIGVKSTHLADLTRSCTICDAARFESYRRDGTAAG
ncbi:MAG: polyphenol oxidase family protein, partial [Myxococcota bacterium]